MRIVDTLIIPDVGTGCTLSPHRHPPWSFSGATQARPLFTACRRTEPPLIKAPLPQEPYRFGLVSPTDSAEEPKILAHLNLPTTLPQPCAARAPPWSEDELDQGELDFDDDLDVDAASRLERCDDVS